jgi:glycerol uptake facilitator-like aquaporin
LAAVVGSGIMGERLAEGNAAVTLLANALATGAALVVLITILGPISGAHFNPLVTFAMAWRRALAWHAVPGYIAAQTIGAVLGVWAAHAMFGEAVLQVSAKLRDGPQQAFAEAVASFGLIVAILGTLRFRPEAIAWIVGLYITAAYWFTASTSFANPAVTLARSLTDSFAGIAPASVPWFLVGQLAGAGAALLLSRWLFAPPR